MSINKIACMVLAAFAVCATSAKCNDGNDNVDSRGMPRTTAHWSDGGPSCRPETWFHIIGGNASKEGIAADIAAIAEAGIGGIQFFHGGWAKDEPWPGVTNMVPCLSRGWVDLVKFTETECHRRGLSFKMQNCPGWSMSGGPWITPDKAMRRLVCFEPGKKPGFDADDDYREIGAVTFPLEDSPDMSITVPNPRQIDHTWAYEPDADIVLCDGPKEMFRVRCPRGAWADDVGMTFRVPGFPVSGRKLFYYSESSHYPRKELNGSWMPEPRLDMWEAKAGWAYRSFAMSGNASPVKTRGERTLVFGHVNAKRRNGPAPAEGTGWECDKMDARGFEANFAGYLGKLLKSGVKIDGTLVDSWECGCQTWTWKMEEEFERRAGYPLRPWLPALFGYVLKSEAETERFLLDWRNVCSRLVEENYYGAIARLARENGMSVQYETAFGDVIPGDPLRFWKFADEPMCEFWSPHRNKGYVGSFDFKPILPCASAAHIYGKRRVSAEALTSFDLTFDENFKDWKKIVDEHFARGVTHIVFHTYTHNPVVGGKPPSTSFGAGIGSPFLREQTWWPFLKHFSKYIERCGAELERGLPAADILLYLGDDVGYRPSEHDLMFGNRYKYDYLNNDALTTRVDVCNGLIVLPDGAKYRVIWIPKDTFLLPATEAKLVELANRGARIVRGDFTPDWPSPFEKFLGRDPSEVAGWFQRRDVDADVFFVAEKDGTSRFFRFPAAGKGDPVVYDPVSGEESSYSDYLAARRRGASASVSVELNPIEEYPAWAVKRVYEGKVDAVPGGVLNLEKVRDWATVYVNGKKAADLWCEPYACDITPFLESGRADIRVEVTSTWYNALVHDAGLPEEERTTWTKDGPKSGSPYHDAGLLDRTAVLRLHSSEQEGTRESVHAAETVRQVGLFYFLWLGEHGRKGPWDVSKILADDPDAGRKPDGPMWGPWGAYHHWGEPLYGYYFSDDEWVVRRHMKLIMQAGVDFLFFDTTNGPVYEKNAKLVMRVLQEYRDAGWTVPKVMFYTNTASGKTVRRIYDAVYGPGYARDVWYELDGKPVIVAKEEECDEETKSFFTIVKSQWPNEPSKKGGWPWMDFTRPQRVFEGEKVAKSVMNVSVAQHPQLRFGDSAMYGEKGNCGRAFHDGANDPAPGAWKKGYNFQEQWDRAHAAKPDIVLVTGWNEWIAGRWQTKERPGRPIQFVDCANAEYSRDIEMMRGGYGDNYFIQLRDNVRRFKGLSDDGAANPPRTARRYRCFSDSAMPRDWPGYGTNYVNRTQRNAPEWIEVEHDSESVVFRVKTQTRIVGQDGEGDFMRILVNGKPVNGLSEMKVMGDVMTLKVPRAAMGLTAREFRFGFKFVDSTVPCKDPMDWYDCGVVEPLGRIEFRYKGKDI